MAFTGNKKTPLDIELCKHIGYTGALNFILSQTNYKKEALEERIGKDKTLIDKIIQFIGEFHYFIRSNFTTEEDVTLGSGPGKVYLSIRGTTDLSDLEPVSSTIQSQLQFWALTVTKNFINLQNKWYHSFYVPDHETVKTQKKDVQSNFQKKFTKFKDLLSINKKPKTPSMSATDINKKQCDLVDACLSKKVPSAEDFLRLQDSISKYSRQLNFTSKGETEENPKTKEEVYCEAAMKYWHYWRVAHQDGPIVSKEKRPELAYLAHSNKVARDAYIKQKRKRQDEATAQQSPAKKQKQ